MKITYTPEMTFEAMQDAVRSELPEYTTEIKKNPLLGFQYLEVKKSGTVGVWVRVFEEKRKSPIDECHPFILGETFIRWTFVDRLHIWCPNKSEKGHWCRFHR